MSLSDRLLALAPRESEPRVLTVDIETSPNVCYVWSLYGEQHISPSQIIEPSRILSVAAKWRHAKGVMYWSEHHHSREEMIRESWRVYDEASVVITYNGRGFDHKHLQREWLLAGLGPPSPWVDVDLLQVVRRKFKFPTAKLGYVTEVAGLPTKLETGGQALWNDVLAGDEKAWAKFKAYNKQDVIVTELLAAYLADWIDVPHMGQWTRDRECCHRCGSPDLTLVGLVYGRTTAYPKLQCDVCGAWNKVLRNGDTRPA